MTLADLLAGIAAHPFEGERWLILADWLEDQGDPRAELARLRYQYHYEPDHPDGETRRLQMLDLWARGGHALVPTLAGPLGMTFALIPPGTFQMGSPTSEHDRRDDEIRHRQTLAQPFFLALHLVTVEQFRQFAAAAEFRTRAELQGETLTWRGPGITQGQQHPVVRVDWHDGQALAAWLNDRYPLPGLVYALPTEAQWEYACRAGSTTAFFWGDDASRLDEFVWYNANAAGTTHPVGSKMPNPWGLWHLPGNVWEWTATEYRPYAGDSPTRQARPVVESTMMSVRGGGWDHGVHTCRSAFRGTLSTYIRVAICGFRIALNPVESPA